MSDLLQKVKSVDENQKKGYSLVEIVGVLNLLNEKVSLSDIALLTGRSMSSLRYKFLETKPTKGQTKPRSIHQYPSIVELFADYGEVYSEESLAEKIEEFKKTFRARAEV